MGVKFNPLSGQFDFTSGSVDLSGYVPYTGATADVDLGAYNLIATSAQILDSNTNVIIGDLTGDARGGGSVDVQSDRTLSNYVASGNQATALGYSNESSGLNSTAIGYLNIASGARGLAIGWLNQATGSNRVVAIGTDNISSGTRGVAVGRTNTVIGSFSSAFGADNTVNGGNSSAFGSTNLIDGSGSIVCGNSNYAIGEDSSVFGIDSNTSGDYSVAVGYRVVAFQDYTVKFGNETSFFAITSSGFSITNDNPLAAVHSTGDLLVTDTTSLGSELVTNGSFASGASWTVGTGWAIASGAANKNAVGVGTLSQTISITAGKYYYVTFDVAQFTVGSLSISVGGATGGILKPTGSGGSKSYKAVIKAVSTAGIVFTPLSSDTIVGYIDNVSVKEITGGDILAPLGGIEAKTLKINEGATLTGIFSATATLDFPSISSNSTAELTMTVTGAEVGDSVAIGAPSGLESGLTFCGFVSSANTVTIRVHNASGGALDPASATWRATVINY